MTTCIYCEKNKDEVGDYKEFDCKRVKARSTEYWEDVCERCKYYIEGGEEVPYTL